MSGLPPFLANKGNSGGAQGGQSGGPGGGSVPPQFMRGKNKKKSQGRADAIARRMAALKQKR